jgi:hypothetical protein
MSTYDFSGTTTNGPSFQISFDASPPGPASNFTFAVNGQPVAGVTGSFDWYDNALDVGNGSTIFRGEIDHVLSNNPIFGGPDIGDLFYQGQLYTLSGQITVTDPPTGVSAPTDILAICLWVVVVIAAMAFSGPHGTHGDP